MVRKFNPTYQILIEKSPEAMVSYGDSNSTTEQSANFIGTLPEQEFNENPNFIEINFPLTVEFDIYKSTIGSANTAYFNIYNLNEESRSLIVKDRFTQNEVKIGQGRRRIIFRAGYENNLVTCFYGNLVEAFTERKGVDLITRIEAQDSSYEMYNALSNISLDRSVSSQEILNLFIKDLGLTKGAIGNVFENTGTSRGYIYIGNTYEEIRRLYPNTTFVDNGVINFLNPNECLTGLIPVINNETGLMGIPRRQEGKIIVESLFEPYILIAQLVEIQSQEDARFDGQYKVLTAHHTGTISGSVDGERTSRFELLIGTDELGVWEQLEAVA